MKALHPAKPFVKTLSALLSESRKKKDPASWLHEQNARRPLFMLEALARLMYRISGEKQYRKWKKTFKKLEDMFGDADHYAELAVVTSGENTHRAVKEYIHSKKRKSLDKLNRKLEEENFYSDFLKRFEHEFKMDLNSETFAEKIKSAMRAELKECELFFGEYENGFSDMETQVHELRRKLRWISIYSQALQGLVQLKPVKTVYKWEKAFIPKGTDTSEFMKLPVTKGLQRYILLNRKAFAALCFVIAELGRIKDKGLSEQALAKAIRKTEEHFGSKAYALAQKQLHEQMDLPALLKEAHKLLYSFFKTHRIHRLLLTS